MSQRDLASYTAADLADPSIDPSILQQLTGSRPDLWTAILANPQCYPALDAYIRERLASQAPAAASGPTTGTAAASSPATATDPASSQDESPVEPLRAQSDPGADAGPGDRQSAAPGGTPGTTPDAAANGGPLGGASGAPQGGASGSTPEGPYAGPQDGGRYGAPQGGHTAGAGTAHGGYGAPQGSASGAASARPSSLNLAALTKPAHWTGWATLALPVLALIGIIALPLPAVSARVAGTSISANYFSSGEGTFVLILMLLVIGFSAAFILLSKPWARIAAAAAGIIAGVIAAIDGFGTIANVSALGFGSVGIGAILLGLVGLLLVAAGVITLLPLFTSGRTSTSASPQQGFGPAQGAQGYGAPQGYPGQGAPQGYPGQGAPQGFPGQGAPQGYGSSQNAQAPQSYPGHGAPQGYGTPQGTSSPQGYGASAQGSQASQGYGAPQGGSPFASPQQAQAPGQGSSGQNSEPSHPDAGDATSGPRPGDQH